jgi:hypothetical protein
MIEVGKNKKQWTKTDTKREEYYINSESQTHTTFVKRKRMKEKYFF